MGKNILVKNYALHLIFSQRENFSQVSLEKQVRLYDDFRNYGRKKIY